MLFIYKRSIYWKETMHEWYDLLCVQYMLRKLCMLLKRRLEKGHYINKSILISFAYRLNPIFAIARIKIDDLLLFVLYWSSISFYVVWNSLIMLGLCDFCIKTFIVTKFPCLHMTQMNNACCTFYETYYLSSIVEPWNFNISVA